MQGLAFTLLEGWIVEDGGEAALERVLAAAGLSRCDPWVATGDYPLEELRRLVGAAAAECGLPAAEFLLRTGRRAVPLLMRRYASLVAGFESMFDLFGAMAGVIQPQWRRLHRGTDNPPLAGRVLGAGCVCLECEGAAGLCAALEGVLLGLGDHFGTPVLVEHARCAARGDAACELRARRVRRQRA